MPRLPTPEVVEIKIESPEDIDQRMKDFYSMILTAIMKKEINDKKEGIGKDETD